MRDTSRPCKVVLLTTHLTATVLLAGYSAALISSLTTKQTELPFTDFPGLLRKGTHKLGLLPNSGQFDYMKVQYT